MKRILILILTLSLLLTAVACQSKDSENPSAPGGDANNSQSSNGSTDGNGDSGSGDSQNGTPDGSQPEEEKPLTREEKIEQIKNEVLALFESVEGETSKSPLDLFRTLERDYSVTDLQAAFGEAPESILQKGGKTVVTYGDRVAYGFALRDLAFWIEQYPNGSFAADDPISASSYSPSILTAFGFNTSFFAGSSSNETPSLPEAEFPEVKAEHLTVNEDLATCTIDAELFRSVLSELAKATGYTDPEIVTLLADYRGSVVYTVATKTLTAELAGKSRADGDLITTLTLIDAGENGKTMEVGYSDSAISDDIPISTELTYALRNIKYRGDDPISGTLDVRMKAITEQTILGSPLVIAVDNRLTVSLDVSNENAPVISASEINNTETTLRGTRLPDYCEATTAILKYEPQKTSKRLTYTKIENNQITADLSANAILFETPTAEVEIPATVLAYAESIYGNYTE